MRIKAFVILLLVSIIAVSIITATSKSINDEAKKDGDYKTISAVKTPVNPIQGPADPLGTIDGVKNPELIPDKVAYSILFRFLSNRQTEAEKNRVRFYLKLKLGGGNCDETKEMKASTNNIIDALLTAAEQFNQRVTMLDNQVKSIKDQRWPNPNSETMTQLTQLQSQKEALVIETVASLQTRLNSKGIIKVQQLVHDNFKRKIKIAPSPQSPPGGPGWRDMSSHH